MSDPLFVLISIVVLWISLILYLSRRRRPRVSGAAPYASRGGGGRPYSGSGHYVQPAFLNAIRLSTESYPLLYLPQPGEGGLYPYFRKDRGVRGVTELPFERLLRKHLFRRCQDLIMACSEFQVSGNAYLPLHSEGRPYEPDISVIATRGGQRILIDVEIDEPYVGLTHEPTHYIQGRDRERDMLFISKGWIVLRFSEQQVHFYGYACACEVERLLQLAFTGRGRGSLLEGKRRTYRWTKERAIQWAKEGLRERYLGIDTFGDSSQESATSFLPEEDAFVEDTEHLIYSEVEESYSYAGDQLRFVPEFIAQGYPAHTVSTEILALEEKLRDEIGCFLEDPEHVASEEVAELATELRQFGDFYSHYIETQRLSVSEHSLPICLPELQLAGELDLLAQDPHGGYHLFAWVKQTSPQAFLEQALYRHILRQRYGIELVSSYLVLLDPTRPSYALYPVEPRPEELTQLLGAN